MIMMYDGYPIYGISIEQTENENYFRGYVLSCEKGKIFVTEYHDRMEDVLRYIMEDIHDEEVEEDVEETK